MKLKVVLATILVGLAGMIGFQIHSLLTPKNLAGTTTLFPTQGGTGINTATTSNIGQVLSVLSSSPFTYTLTSTIPTLLSTSITSTNLNISGLTNLGNTTITNGTSTNLAVTTLATTTAGTCLQSNSLGSIFNGFCPTMANQTLFFQNSSSSITQYKSMIALTQTGSENFVTTTGVVDAQVLMGWASATNSPNVATILAGTYSLKIRASQTAGTKSGFIYGQIFTRTAGGTETLLGTTAASPLLTSVETEINLSVFISATDTPITNRFVVKFFSTVTGAGTAPTIVLGYGDATAAGFNFPSTAADITLLVPYSGWLSNVNGGSFGLTASFVSTTNATTTNLWIQTLYDSTGSKGTNGMVLQTNGTIDTWVTTSSLNISGGGSVSSGLAGQNAFYGTDGTTLIGTSSLFILPNKSINIGTTTNPIGATFNVVDVSGLMTANFASSLGVSYFHIMDVGMTGINTSTPSERLTIVGTGTENPFAIRTSTAAAASMLNVLTNGNVGINTNTPIDTLSVQGGFQVIGGVTSTNLNINNLTNLANTTITNVTSTNANITGTSALATVTVSGRLNVGATTVDSSNAQIHTRIDGSGDEGFRADNANNGASATALLDLRNGALGSTEDLRVFAGGTSYANLTASWADTGVVSAQNGLSGGLVLNAGTKGISFEAGGNGSTFQRMFISSSTGNVGINSSTPLYLLGITMNTGGNAFDISSSTGDVMQILADNTFNIGIDSSTAGINIGTIGSGRALIFGNAVGTSSVAINCGTGACNFGTSATNHLTTIGSTANGAGLTDQTGTGVLNLTTSGANAGGIVATNNSITSLNVLTVTSSATAMTSGGLLNLNKFAGTGSTAYTGNIVNLNYSQTFNGGVGLVQTGKLFNATRTIIENSAGATNTISGAMVTFSDNASVTTGTLSSGADVLDVTQNYSSNTGAVVNIVNLGTGIGLSVSSSLISFIGLGTNGITGNLLCWNTSSGAISQEAASCTISSAYFKENIKSLSPETLMNESRKLRAVLYDLKSGDDTKTASVINAGRKENEGFIAEEVAMIDPKLVDYTTEYTKEELAWVQKNYAQTIIKLNGKLYIPHTVDYARITVIDTGAIQNLDDRLSKIEHRTTLLENFKVYVQKFIDSIKPLINSI